MIEVKDFDERSWLIQRVEELEVTNMSLEKNTYAAPHVWNLVAKQIRIEYEGYTQTNNNSTRHSRRVLENLALAFAKRFTEDDGFEPLTWLDKCSSDPDLYPLSELWENDKE